MLVLAVVFVGAFFSGTLVIGLISWAFGKITAAEHSSDPTGRVFVGYIGASALAIWGYAGDGASAIYLVTTLFANATGALVVRALIKRRQPIAYSDETFD